MVAATAKKPSKKTQTPAVTPFDLPDDKATAVGAELQPAAPAVPATPAEAPAEPVAAPATPVADAGLTVGKIAARLSREPLPKVIEWALAQEGATLYAAPLAAMVAQRSADAGKMTPAALAQLDAVIASLRDADAMANAPVYQMIVEAIAVVADNLPLGAAPAPAAAAPAVATRAKGPTKPKAPAGPKGEKAAKVMTVALTSEQREAVIAAVKSHLAAVKKAGEAPPMTDALGKAIADQLDFRFTDFSHLLPGLPGIVKEGAGKQSTYRLA